MTRYEQEREFSEMLSNITALSREVDAEVIRTLENLDDHNAMNGVETGGLMIAYCAMLASELPEDNFMRQSFIKAFKEREYELGNKLVLLKLDENNE